MSRPRSTIRLRLTLLYAASFFVAGAVLIAVMYFSLEQWLDRRPAATTHMIISKHLALGDRMPGTERLAEAIAAQAAQERRDVLRAMLISSLTALAVVGIAAAGFGWLLAGRALAPLQRVTATARRVADRSLHERIALEGPPDEIKDLADTFDAMLERLDRAFDSQRRFVANASHELRTPLAINRTLIEVALDRPDAPESLRQLGETLLEVNGRHERLIDGLLLLVSSEQQLIERRRCDLAGIARHVADLSTAEATGAEVSLDCDVSPAPVDGDPILLERLVHNLVDNAVRYNRPGGRVRIECATETGAVRLTVANTGRMVPEFELDGLFEPFRRAADTTRRATDPGARRGAGLGLSIVRSVAHAHGGTVHAAADPDGGLIITMSLPAPGIAVARRPTQ
ncbi:sensor histidine kinase [Nocardia rhizosphaerihabitans]|uniref:histidine kinase n=1 Tax=Nocardia rhizosphaerihabitans TaxID=1691570 RepID=A0ABQ2KYU7_9NOCA|nr:ATP-binding protein [Nocardia rhizosphaerihabitans]GGN94783.1 sensor protein CutS [Nocardia rhizosphaerihabitans]